jgi:hypothetical protein
MSMSSASGGVRLRRLQFVQGDLVIGLASSSAGGNAPALRTKYTIAQRPDARLRTTSFAVFVGSLKKEITCGRIGASPLHQTPDAVPEIRGCGSPAGA